jgi:hypothetical protein
MIFSASLISSAFLEASDPLLRPLMPSGTHSVVKIFSVVAGLKVEWQRSRLAEVANN